MNIFTQISIFIGEILLIYILSRMSLQRSYVALKRYLKNDRVIIFLISLAYIPGTIIHELSHYFVALLLNMHPREITFFPTVEGRRVKLGHVLYERRKGDFIRPLLIGIAPFFGGLACLWIIIQANLFPGVTIWNTIIFGYLILAITANMFSSKQDLIDVGYTIPIGFILTLTFTLFPIKLDLQFIVNQVPLISYFLSTLQIPLLFSLVIHGILVLLLMKFK